MKLHHCPKCQWPLSDKHNGWPVNIYSWNYKNYSFNNVRRWGAKTLLIVSLPVENFKAARPPACIFFFLASFYFRATRGRCESQCLIRPQHNTLMVQSDSPFSLKNTLLHVSQWNIFPLALALRVNAYTLPLAFFCSRVRVGSVRTKGSWTTMAGYFLPRSSTSTFCPTEHSSRGR